MPPSARSSSAARARTVGVTCSHRAVAAPVGVDKIPPDRSTSSSSMSSTTPKRRPTAPARALPPRAPRPHRHARTSRWPGRPALVRGHTAAELRIWEALGADLLSPFHYFAASDGTDVPAIEWKRGVTTTTAVSTTSTPATTLGPPSSCVRSTTRWPTSHDAGARVLRQRRPCRVHGSKVRRSRHSRPCAGCREPPWNATATFPSCGRATQAVYAVDLFNEGLDVPDVDTVLMLRPTESATIFLQQLGRGLAHA